MVIKSQNLWHIKQVITSTLSNDSVNCILQNKKLIEIFFFIEGCIFITEESFVELRSFPASKRMEILGQWTRGPLPVSS